MKRLTLAFLLGSVFTVGCGQRLVELPPKDDVINNPPLVPVLTALQPQRGVSAGGTTVVITGTNLDGATGVTFGSATATFTVNSSSQITATSPAGTGTVDVTVFTPRGTSNTLPFAYGDAPLITGITPAIGSTSGGETVVLTGSAFTDASSVTFDGTAATYVVDSASQITAVTPAHAAGTIQVVVTTPVASSNGFNFTYGSAPTLTSIAPALGPTTGGTTLTLTGTNLTGATAVTFDTTAVTTLTVVSDTSVTVVTPPHAAGVAQVTITTPFGTSDAVDFTYGLAPTLTSATPPLSPTAGGINVVLTGANLTGATSVLFGTTPATSFTVDSATQITAVAPAGTSAVNITVTTAFGTSAGLPFGYGDAPVQVSLSPVRGLIAGGLSVVITGENFTGATAVTFGGTDAASFTVDSDTQITAVTPAGAVGAVDVVTTTPDGTSNALTFTYGETPGITNAAPDFGPSGGGSIVVLTGTSLAGATAVTFGAVDAPSFVVDSAVQISVTAPAGTAGDVQITVTTPFGTSNGVTFTYGNVPTIDSVTPPVGPLGGGTSVVITGTDLTDATSVAFGANPAASFTVDSATQITAVSPPGTGAVNISVTTRYGTSNTLPFAYGDAPTIGALAPERGLITGGNTVTISGTNFTPLATVLFGTNTIANVDVTFVSATQISVLAPADTVGAKLVTVTTEFGTSNTSSYTYGIAPTLSGISPNAGPSGGGTTVTLTGTNLTDTTGVTFGGTPVTPVVLNDSTVTFVTPVAGAGVNTVQLTTLYGTATTSFTAVNAPSIGSLDVTVGPTAGGTIVVISGANLATTNSVTFGGTPATINPGGTDSSVSVTTPSGSVGAVNVVISTAGGSATVPNGFTYANVPSVSAITPDAGSDDGGDSITITGAGFLGVTSVTFGGVPTTSLVVNSDTSLTVTSPMHGAGAVDVVVTNPAGSATVIGGFTYLAVGLITGVSDAPAVVTGVNLDWLGTDPYLLFFCSGFGCSLETSADTDPVVGVVTPTSVTIGGTLSGLTIALCPATVVTYDTVACTNAFFVP